MILRNSLRDSFFVFLLSASSTFFLSSSAFAYIPPYWMILSRTADNHGKNFYSIDQTVVFSHGEEPLTVNEHWSIAGENSMRLEVTGRQQLRDRIRLTYIYHNGKRHFIDETGRLQSDKISPDFFEVYFHFRYSKSIKPLLVMQNIAPAISLKSEAHRYSPKNPLATPEPYVRLARSGGVINYAIGVPTPIASADQLPGIWIEQDQFVIRKLRLQSGVEVTAQKYKNFSGGLWLPQERRVSWGEQSVEVNLNHAAALASSSAVKTTLDPNSLNASSGLTASSDPTKRFVLPEDQVIREFYNRMR